MKEEVEFWKTFWGDKTDPLHSSSDGEYYKKYGKELSVLLPPKFNSVLELGCGSGSLYEPLGFHKMKTYVGVDLSSSMLEKFNASYPGLDLYESSAEAYKDNGKYDLIFSNGVIQYFTIDMLMRQINNALEMLSEDGVIIHSSIPWVRMRRKYVQGVLMPPYERRGLKVTLLYWATQLGIKKDIMGKWYSIEEIKKVTEPLGLKPEFYGSMYYPYRFHVSLKRY